MARICTEVVTPSSPTGGYNNFWLEQGDLHARTALLVEPADGRLPAVTPEEQADAGRAHGLLPGRPLRVVGGFQRLRPLHHARPAGAQ